MAKKRPLLPQKACFRCDNVHSAIVETSRETVIKYDLLLNMNLISNLGNIRVIRL